eukprot:12031068-Ditylum_brightwellii.AAC.1
MMLKIQSEIDNIINKSQQKHLDYFNSCLSTISSNVDSNKESLQNIESKLDAMSKFEYQINKAEKIYVDQQKAINECTSDIESHA